MTQPEILTGERPTLNKRETKVNAQFVAEFVLPSAVRAQESGAAPVVVLAGVLLAIFGGPKPKLVSLPIAADAVVQTTEIAISVSRNGASTEYPIATGWSVRGESGSQTLVRKTTVNKFLDPDNLVLVAKDASFIAIMAIGMTAIIVMGGIDLSVDRSMGWRRSWGVCAQAPAGRGAGHLRGGIGDGRGRSGVVHVDSRRHRRVLPLSARCAGWRTVRCIVGSRVHPFVITLGTMAVIRGAVFLVNCAAIRSWGSQLRSRRDSSRCRSWA